MESASGDGQDVIAIGDGHINCRTAQIQFITRDGVFRFQEVHHHHLIPVSQVSVDPIHFHIPGQGETDGS